jgi:hypothetical protein
MPYPSTPCGLTTPETALRPFLGWPGHRAGGLRPSSTPLDTPRRTPMIFPSTELPPCIEPQFQTTIGVRRGVSKRVEDGRRPQATLRAGYP